MNSFLKNSGILLSTLILAACGSDDDHSHGGDEHAHDDALFISQSDTTALSVLEEGVPANLEAAAAVNGASLLLSSTGEQVAIITDGQVQFAAHHEEEEGEEEAHEEEEHELPELSETTVTGSNPVVVNTNGHFSVLVAGATQLVPFDALTAAGNQAEALGLAIAGNEAYPALLLEEGTETIALGFSATHATIFEDGVASEDLNHTFACASVYSVAQNSEFAVISCDESNFTVKLEEGETDHTIEITELGNVDSNVEWAYGGGVFVGYSADNGEFFVLEEAVVAEEEVLTLEATLNVPDNFCAWGIDSLEAEIFALHTTGTAEAYLDILTHEGGSTSIQLDETPIAATCDDLRMATASQAVSVLDNNGAVVYEIDKEEGAAQYHIHGRETLSVTDVESAVIFHEVGTDSHNHAHE